MIQYLINEAKTELGLSLKLVVFNPISPPHVNPSPVSDLPLQFTPFSPASAWPFPSSPPGNSYLDPQVNGNQRQVHKLGGFIPQRYSYSVLDDFRL